MTASQPARRPPGRPRLLNDAPAPAAPSAPRVGWQDGTLAVSWDFTAEAWAALAQLAERQAAQARAQAEYLRCTTPPLSAADEPRWVTVAQAAKHLGVSEWTVRTWLREAGSAVRVNRRLRGVRLALADLDQWVAEQPA